MFRKLEYVSAITDYRLAAGDVHHSVEVTPCIVALQDIPEFHIEDFDIDYDGIMFNVEQGDIKLIQQTGGNDTVCNSIDSFIRSIEMPESLPVPHVDNPAEIKRRIKDHIEREHGYDLSRTLDEIHPDYRFDVSCQGSVPQAITAFLESTDFEDAIRNAISIGGDSDTIAAITGSIAEAAYGIPDWIKKKAYSYLDESLKGVLRRWRKFVPHQDPV